MELTRTANAGVLLKLDGVSILLDGVCREVKPYLATPLGIKDSLLANFPDAVAFTHTHEDHYDPTYASDYQKQTGRVIFGPVDQPGCQWTMEPGYVGHVKIIPLPSRHIGAAWKNTLHASFIVQGSQCVWFLGDASPSLWKGREDLPKPDVLLVPYAYAMTEVAWSITKNLGAKNVVLLHLPDRKNDVQGLWNAVETVVDDRNHLHILFIGDTIQL
ncbi:MAG: MBL fold metallo-hydrolase [Oscillospiraceae bacterium]|nr:MBL fold metallo-hydrolase [Oscillospiraceae bacterium]